MQDIRAVAHFAPLLATMAMPALVVAAFGGDRDARATPAAGAARVATASERRLVADTAAPIPTARVAVALANTARMAGHARRLPSN